MSLLSNRIKRRRKLDFEKKHAGENIDKFLPNYIPPCFWSANAFSSNSSNITFNHPFPTVEKKIESHLPSYSVFTWPFRLSFNHSEKKRKTEGRYPPNLKERVDKFFDQFKANDRIENTEK